MKRIYLLSLVLLLSTIIFAAKYTQVTSTDDLKSGDKVIFGCAAKGVVAGTLTGTNMPAVTATLEDTTFITSDAEEFTLSGGGSSWTFTCASGTIGCTGEKNALSVDPSASKYTAGWTLSIEDGTASLLCSTSKFAYTYMYYNASAKIFTNYSSKQTAIEIYKKVVTTTPTIETLSSVDFGQVNLSGESASDTATLMVEGLNLTAPIEYIIATGDDNFSATGTLTAEGGILTLIFTATEEGSFAGQLYLSSGTAEATVNLTATVVGSAGAGTKESPYSCADVIKLNNPSTNAWVTGYILGSAATGPIIAKTPNNTSLLLADDMEGTNKIAVALPSGTIRTDLNVVDHADYVGLRVKVYGSLVAYFGGPGVKNTSDYELLDTPTALNEVEGEASQVCHKVVRDGQIVIIRDGVAYTILGALAK